MNGQQFLRARLKLGLRQVDIAKLFRISESTIHRWERQATSLKIDPLHSLLCQHIVWLSAAPDPLFFRDILRWACRKDMAGFGLFALLKLGFDDFEGQGTYAERVKAWAVSNGFKEEPDESAVDDLDEQTGSEE